ncbi:unnamed protein product [Brachionus calyciflorus]|uniref:Uncharacterized protein n=1 Tax=Brachionus calyciflorus TaxID=104777 RepID=A0A813Y579_9BILA|nr:unnamed protein product [Brachionus calyciflorus]
MHDFFQKWPRNGCDVLNELYFKTSFNSSLIYSKIAVISPQMSKGFLVTKLKSDFYQKLNGLNIYRADRIDKLGGKATLTLKENKISKKINTPPNNELLDVEITTENYSTLSLLSLYSSPKSQLDFNLPSKFDFN